jgi:four helix bundle protein
LVITSVVHFRANIVAIQSYRDLVVWQKGMKLVETIYRTTAGFPKDEIYGLRQQMRRAATSVPCNIAEGQGRRTTRDFLHFLSIAHGSLREVDAQTLIAGRLGCLSQAAVDGLLQLSAEVARLNSRLMAALEKRL